MVKSTNDSPLYEYPTTPRYGVFVLGVKGRMWFDSTHSHDAQRCISLKDLMNNVLRYQSRKGRLAVKVGNSE